MKSRFHSDRETQLASLSAKGWRIIRYKAAPIVVAVEVTASGKAFAKGWHGKADKTAFYYSFATVARAEQFVTEWAKKVAGSYAYRADQKAESRTRREALKASDHWTVGDVIYNSWGYDQTNIDFYEVVEVKARSIVVRELKQNYAETGFMSGRCQPRRGEFCGELLMKPLDDRGGIIFRHGGASKWDGKPKYSSSYA